MASISRLHLPAVFALTMTLKACAVGPPPPTLTDADLRAAMTTDLMSEMHAEDARRLPADLDIVRSYASMPGTCINLRRSQTSLAHNARDLKSDERSSSPFGLGGGLTNWRKPGPIDDQALNAAVANQLAAASVRAIRNVSSAKLQPDSEQGWPSWCKQRYWFDQPVFVDRFAFIERGMVCGGLCGNGSVLALEYRDKRWRVVGITVTWMA